MTRRRSGAGIREHPEHPLLDRLLRQLGMPPAQANRGQLPGGVTQLAGDAKLPLGGHVLQQASLDRQSVVIHAHNVATRLDRRNAMRRP